MWISFPGQGSLRWELRVSRWATREAPNLCLLLEAQRLSAQKTLLAGMICLLKKESLDMSVSSLGFLHTVCERFGREEKYKSAGCYKDLIAK